MKSNCEKDNSVSLIKNFHDIMLKDKSRRTNAYDNSVKTGNEPGQMDLIIFDPEPPILNSTEKGEVTSVSNQIFNDLMKRVNCELCVSDLHSENVNDANSLRLPSDVFKSNFVKLFFEMNAMLPDMCTEKNLNKTMISKVEGLFLDVMGCTEHCEIIKTKFINIVAIYMITSFCKDINDLLSNKITSLCDSFKGIQIYEVALNFRRKKKHIAKYSPTLKNN